MINELFERELRNTSINGVSLDEYIKENYIPKKYGKWIEHEIEDTMRWVTCSKYNCETHKKFNYCPNCGAKMSEILTGSEGSDKE